MNRGEILATLNDVAFGLRTSGETERADRIADVIEALRNPKLLDIIEDLKCEAEIMESTHAAFKHKLKQFVQD